MEEKNTGVSNQLDCKNCGALLKYAPGTTHLKCEYCGAENEIAESEQPTVVEEIDFELFLNEHAGNVERTEIITVKCDNCGAATTLAANITSDACPFCSSPLVVQQGSTSSIIKPSYLLPFSIDQKKAFEAFKKWIGGLWFAPNDLKKYVDDANKLNGMYIPYWTYDANTVSRYTGARGTEYQTTESYTTYVDGKQVTETRTVTKVSWSPVSGTVEDNFDDLLVLASNSLPVNYSRQLEPWDLEHLAAFSEKYLSGFRTEQYQVDVKTGFEQSKQIMSGQIRSTICRDIGGDRQMISSVNTAYNDITFKHILLPIWLSAFKYNSKVYHFMINGRTGEVQGERPYSTAKIVLAVLAFLSANTR